jgi:hypothetical protein
MAESRSATKRRGAGSSGSGSSAAKRARSGGSSSKRATSRASSRRVPTATKRSAGTKSGGSQTKSRNGGDPSRSNRGMTKEEEAKTGGKPMGRPPADEPDVSVHVPKVHVGELCIDVDRLEAHLALRAQVANLVQLIAGTHVGVDNVNIDIKDVDAECELKVRLENTYNILDRTLTTLDENPEIVKGLLETADTAVQETGEIGKEATRPGAAVTEITSGVGDTLGSLGKELGNTLSSVTDKARPKQIAGGNGPAAKPESPGSSSALSKTAASAGAAAAAGLLGGALLGGRKGRRLLRRRTSLQSLAKGVYRAGKQVGKARKEPTLARRTAERVLP